MKDRAIYCRVSTRDQRPENQRLELVAFAERMGYSYEVFEEVESTRNSRPIQAGLMNRLRRKEFAGVLVWRLDRWGRSLSEMILSVKELTDKGIVFVSLRDNIDLATPSGVLMFHVFSALAEFERSIIQERTFLGLERAKKEGKVLGRPPGSKDTKARRKSGYFLRYTEKSGSYDQVAT